MIIAVDCETIGLNCQAFVLGCLQIDGKEPETYYKKEDLWERILELGKKCKKNNTLLTVIAHNHEYDFYSYADLEQEGITIHLENPFIAHLRNKEINIKFLDSYGLFRMSLKKAAKLIGMRKKEMPIELEMSKEFINEKAKEKIKEYCENDTTIALELYKAALKEGNKHVKFTQVYTIYQMAIATIIKELCKMSGTESLLYNKKVGCTHKTNHADFIHGAYRGGRVEAFNKGKKLTGMSYIDINSLYPYALTKIRLPDLRTERSLREPLRFLTRKEIFEKIGFSKCLILNKSNKMPYLPIRGEEESIYPRYNQYFIGTYTHQELEYAQKRGYQIINIEKTVMYEEGTNHFKKIIAKFYKLRKGATPLENYFYKQYLNGSIGKFAQRNHSTSIIIDHHKNINKRLKKGYEIVNDYDQSLLFKEPKKEVKTKRYYAPQISALTTAMARTIMQEEYDKIPREHIYYTDTDSIIINHEYIHLYEINEEKMGSFKIEHKNTTATIYGKKSYRIGEEIKISGIRSSQINKQNFEEGIITNKKMIGIKSAENIKEVGTFKENTINLNEQQTKHEENHREYAKEWLLIDSDITNIEFFLKDIKEQQKKI